MKIFSILLIGILMTSCSDNNKNEEVTIKKCENSEFIHTIIESVPVTIKMVQNIKNSYERSKVYYELDVETYVPEILESVNNQKTIRLFPLSKVNNEVGSIIMINGKISSCPTKGEDFLPNINLGVYYLLEH